MWLAVVGPPPTTGGVSTLTIALLSVVGIAITALATYFGVRRLNSGGIRTSTAESLWNESNNMRKDLSERLSVAEEKVEAQAKEIEAARADALAAREEAVQWRERAVKMEADTVRMKRQIATLQRQVRELKGKR